MKIANNFKTAPSSFNRAFINDLQDHAVNPPGNDPILKTFYQAVLENYKAKGVFFEILSQIETQRPDITNSHLINLIFRAYQYIKFEDKDLNYRNFKSVSDWQNELTGIFKNIARQKLYLTLLLTKSTNTSIYQRYSGPMAIIKYLYGRSPVSIMDVGCGGNYGLRGVDVASFQEPIDQTPRKFVIDSFSKKVTFAKRIAVDREDPDHEDVYEWRLACSFYPQELDNLENTVKFEQLIRQNKKVLFLKSDFLKSQITVKFEAIIFCVMLYQQDKPTREAFFAKAKKMLKKDGVIIVQDFAKKDSANPNSLNFDTSWFGEKFAHKTMIASAKTNWEFWEVFKWNNGRCQEVIAGEDFDKFLKLKKSFLHHFKHFFQRI